MADSKQEYEYRWTIDRADGQGGCGAFPWEGARQMAEQYRIHRDELAASGVAGTVRFQRRPVPSEWETIEEETFPGTPPVPPPAE